MMTSYPAEPRVSTVDANRRCREWVTAGWPHSSLLTDRSEASQPISTSMRRSCRSASAGVPFQRALGIGYPLTGKNARSRTRGENAQNRTLDAE